MMARETATIVAYAWSTIISALLQYTVRRVAVLYGKAFTEKSIASAFMIGFLAALVVQSVGIIMGVVAGPVAFITGLTTGTLIFGFSFIVSRFVIEMNKAAIANVAKTVKAYWQVAKYYAMAKLGRRDVRRDKARETIRAAA